MTTKINKGVFPGFYTLMKISIKISARQKFFNLKKPPSLESDFWIGASVLLSSYPLIVLNDTELALVSADEVFVGSLPKVVPGRLVHPSEILPHGL